MARMFDIEPIKFNLFQLIYNIERYTSATGKKI